MTRLTQIHRIEDQYLSAWRQTDSIERDPSPDQDAGKTSDSPEGGAATIKSDELFNVYDKTGPEMSDRKPSTIGICGLTPLDRDLCSSHFHHPPGRDLEVIGDALGLTCGPGIASSPCLLTVKHQG